MKDFFKILRRFLTPYKKYLILNVAFNLLAAFLTLFSFALIIPILEMLFELKTDVYDLMPVTLDNFKEAAVNNFYYYTQYSIVHNGPASTLALLGVALVIMTALKCGAQYLAAYFIIPMRSGVVRDIRNTIYDKVTAFVNMQ